MTTRPTIVLGRRRGKNRRTAAATAETLTQHAERAAGAVQKLAFFGLAVVAAVALAVGVAWLWKAATQASRLQIRAVLVSGNERASTRELESYAGIRIGSPIFDLDLDAMALQLRRHPWVESATVRRQLPDKIAIEVREHRPAIIVSLSDAVYLATAEGALFKRLAAGDSGDLPVVTGLSREDAVRQADETAVRVREAVTLAARYLAETPELGRLDELHFDADLGWSIVVSPKDDEARAMRLHLGREPGGRLAVAAQALKRARALGREAGDVWADNDKNPGRVHLRLRDAVTPIVSQTLFAKAK